MDHYDFSDKTVLITGASLGIGAAFARELKRRGAHLVLVARNQTRLEQLAAELGGATVIANDLAAPNAARELFDAVTARGLTIDVLVNNAGFGQFGRFEDIPLSSLRGQIDLNVAALVELTHVFLPMLERQRGGVIQVASTAAFQPVPFMAVYAATKAFVLSFSEALWGEYRERGVRVLALCPGATETMFFERAGEAAAVGKKGAPGRRRRAGAARVRQKPQLHRARPRQLLHVAHEPLRSAPDDDPHRKARDAQAKPARDGLEVHDAIRESPRRCAVTCPRNCRQQRR